MRKPAVLITGAGGEVGFGLIDRFAQSDNTRVIALDIKPLPEELQAKCATSIVGDILDENLLQRLVSEFEIHAIYHLAALLSTRAEYTPDTAHRVNVEGTLNLLKLAHEQTRWHGDPVTFVFPSSIAVYGLPSVAVKEKSGRLRERDWNSPTTMYGCNKAYCEMLGRYYSQHYRQLAAESDTKRIDFRCLRFPGLISAITLPTGGTSDYAAEMIHAAAQGVPYACFVPPEARLPFMVMPDAIKSLVALAEAPMEKLTQRVYNVTSFSMTAAELKERVLKAFPAAKISFDPQIARANIVDTWPGDVDDSPARSDWGWKPDFDARRSFDEYLIPNIMRRYQ